MAFFRKLFSRSAWNPEHVYDADNYKYWGHSIHYSKDLEQVIGHTTPLPKVNDAIIFKCESGQRRVFQIIKIEYCNDPHDMWFAKIRQTDLNPSDVVQKLTPMHY